ncbi:MAG: NUDIX hydrolase [Patescibacteria group bacterium]|nr:NUDIX hydrolase [Patescibacteria group bacterium]
MEKIREVTENIAVSIIWDINKRLLLIFKERENPDESVWMLPGGHSEPSNDKNLQTTAERENVEETTLSGIAGYNFLFHLEDGDYLDKHRVFFVYEGFYLDVTKKINLPKELLKKEGIKKAQWFYPHEVKELPLSTMAIKIIDKVLLPDKQQTSFFARSVNHLQAILGDARNTIIDERKMGELTEEIKTFASFFNQFYAEKDVTPVKKNVSRKKKELVVIVEDDDDVSETTRCVLEKYFRVIVFNNPTSALEWLVKTTKEIKAIIVDYHFSTDKKTGIDFINDVNLQSQKIKTVLFTGYKNERFDGTVLYKPVTQEELICAIRSF